MNFASRAALARVPPQRGRHPLDPVALPNSDPKAPTAYIALGELGEVKLKPAPPISIARTSASCR
jgi:hypothetical protein